MLRELVEPLPQIRSAINQQSSFVNSSLDQ
jgi:hypothetical protein